ncbi:zinc-ribbon domain containing protein [Hydrogenophaga sp.]|uniref:zinc-ribbon domain containing protein n=1 Tax=Hydrogenophaga sp. TaxID=1904254 RepID=UPI003FA60710
MDTPCSCSDCGTEFLFSKEEQRIWYEEYKLPIFARAVRCLACRRRLRNSLQSTEKTASGRPLDSES